jgi:flavorubredoxin
MVTYLKEDKILFSCDLFGSHIATSDLYVTDPGRIYKSAKRYFAEIMMPFGGMIGKNLKKLEHCEMEMIAPSHGQIYTHPEFIIDAYLDWIAGPPNNTVVISYVSMHGSTKQMVDYLVSVLTERAVRVEQFNLEVTDIGKLAMALVDAATVVVGTPTVLAGPHPIAAHAVFLANALRPKTRFLSIIGSYGWGGKTVEVLTGMVPNLKAEVIEPVISKGIPTKEDFEALDKLAAAIAERHKEHRLV